MKPNVERAVAAMAASQQGLISRSQALALGVTRDQIKFNIRVHRWEIVLRSVYRLAGVPQTWKQQLLAVCLTSNSFYASHRSAGRLWGLPGLEGDGIEVSVPRGKACRQPGIRVHESLELAAVDLTKVDGIPVTAPARTLIDLAAILSPDELEEAVDDALRRGLVTLSRLKWRLKELAEHGRPGIAVMRKVLALRTPGDCPPQSVLETRVLRLMKKWGLPEPERQHVVRDNGRVVAVVDFAYPIRMIGIEADGYAYHSGRKNWRREMARSNALEDRGWRMFHLSTEDLNVGAEEVWSAIARALAI